MNAAVCDSKEKNHPQSGHEKERKLKSHPKNTISMK